MESVVCFISLTHSCLQIVLNFTLLPFYSNAYHLYDILFRLLIYISRIINLTLRLCRCLYVEYFQKVSFGETLIYSDKIQKLVTL